MGNAGNRNQRLLLVLHFFQHLYLPLFLSQWLCGSIIFSLVLTVTLCIENKINSNQNMGHFRETLQVRKSVKWHIALIVRVPRWQLNSHRCSVLLPSPGSLSVNHWQQCMACQPKKWPLYKCKSKYNHRSQVQNNKKATFLLWLFSQKDCINHKKMRQ